MRDLTVRMLVDCMVKYPRSVHQQRHSSVEISIIKDELPVFLLIKMFAATCESLLRVIESRLIKVIYAFVSFSQAASI